MVETLIVEKPVLRCFLILMSAKGYFLASFYVDQYWFLHDESQMCDGILLKKKWSNKKLLHIKVINHLLLLTIYHGGRPA